MNHPAVVKAAQEIIEFDEYDHENYRWKAGGELIPDYAEIIERETKYSRLVEAAQGLLDAPFVNESAARNQLRSVLAEIKEG